MEIQCKDAVIYDSDKDGCNATFTDKSDLVKIDKASLSVKRFAFDIITLGLLEGYVYKCPNCDAPIDPDVVNKL